MLFESLENRRHMSASVSARGTLLISGTEHNDVISVVGDGRSIAVVENGVAQLFDASKVKRVTVDLGSGDDVFTAARGVARQLTVDGGAGNDSISVHRRYSKSAILIGNNGNDTLVGGRGDDTLRGGDGNDLLTANKGVDVLFGGNGDDRLDASDDTGSVGHLAVYDPGFRDILQGNNGRDTLLSGAGGDIVNGGAGSDLGGIRDLPDDLISVERFADFPAEQMDPFRIGYLVPVASEFGEPIINLYRDELGNLILQTAIQLNDAGFEIGWNIVRNGNEITVTPTVYRRPDILAGQALTHYSKSFNLGELPSGTYQCVIHDGSSKQATAFYTVTPSFSGVRQELQEFALRRVESGLVGD